MAQPATNPKIEDLRGRLKADPKSRIFFPLAEELRKASQTAEAEQVLRAGLANHPTYLSAWVSLGRALRDQQKNGEAVESLNRALQLDPGNVVAARLLADAYLDLGEKIEAIKKYKLVHALLPADEDVVVIIDRLDRELNPPPPLELSAAPDEHEAVLVTSGSAEAQPFPADEPVFATAEAELDETQRTAAATADDQPMAAAHEDSPFEEPAAQFGYGSAAFEIEAPAGMHEARAPLSADVPSVWEEEAAIPVETAPPVVPEEPADIFAPSEEPEEEDLTSTLTMADLYARQGLVGDARQIYEHILHRDPENHAVRAKLEALPADVPAPEPEPEPEPYDDEAAPLPSPFAPPSLAGLTRVPETDSPFDMPAVAEVAPEPAVAASAVTASPNRAKVEKLQSWLAKVARREGSRV